MKDCAWFNVRSFKHERGKTYFTYNPGSALDPGRLGFLIIDSELRTATALFHSGQLTSPKIPKGFLEIQLRVPCCKFYIYNPLKIPGRRQGRREMHLRLSEVTNMYSSLSSSRDELRRCPEAEGECRRNFHRGPLLWPHLACGRKKGGRGSGLGPRYVIKNVYTIEERVCVA